MDRKEFLQTSALCLAAARLAVLAPSIQAKARGVGPSAPFGYAGLKDRARALAAAAYRPPAVRFPPELSRLTWDQYQAIRFRDHRALWGGDGLRFDVELFHLGLYYRTPVRIHEVVDGRAQELAYDPTMFDYRGTGLRDNALPADLGFAGFRLGFHTDPQRDFAAFLGASYFRAVGGEGQYGLSARGLAVDCGMDRPEEFPIFTSFWIERPAKDSGRLTLYALLDSPSIAGAYRFVISPGASLTMDIDAALYPRRPIERLGIAPLTSMYQCGSNDRRVANDWRPQIHDSDGLLLWTGVGEWIWRPLINPPSLQFNAYLDRDPRGFGLLQRDHNFDHYQDDGAFYDRRPSLWVEPKSRWGPGEVDLVAFPIADETVDNIVAFWKPAAPPQRGQELLFSYRLYWGQRMPFASPLARVVATRTGIGGVVGRPRTHVSWRFDIDFAGANLMTVATRARVTPVVTASRGSIEIASARPLVCGCYRALFDLRPDRNPAPIDLRLYLRLDGQPLTETWLYHWTPPA